jgi:excisionase family DNA binding protein
MSTCRQAAKRLLRTKQAATYLGVSAWKLRQLVWSGQLAYIAASDASPWRFDLCDLDDYIQHTKTIWPVLT